MKKELANTYQIAEPKIKNPKIIIVGVETETIELEIKAILECIVGQNELQTVDEEIMNKIEVLGKFVKKNKNNYRNIILEVQPDVYGKIIKLGRLNIGLKNVRICTCMSSVVTSVLRMTILQRIVQTKKLAKVSEYTRITKDSNTTIDLVFTNREDVKVSVLRSPKISDHDLIEIVANTKTNKYVPKTITFRNKSNLKNVNFEYILQDRYWPDGENVNVTLSNFYKNVTEAQSGQATPPPKDRIPPIVLRDKSKWAGVSTELKRRGLQFLRAQNIADGIRIFPATEADYRSITKFFSNDAIPYHTYQLPSEKLLNVVFRGVPVEISEEELYDGLRERGFSPDCVVRMRSSRNRAPMPLVLVKISKDYKNIYHLKEVVSLDITVETLNSRPTVGQSFRCQRFGHAQSRCTAPKKCVACAGDHESPACPRPKQDPATCANCGEQHPANYRGCSRFPKLRPQIVNQQKHTSPAATRSAEPRSYSQALSGAHQRPQAKTPTTPKSPRVSWRRHATPSYDRPSSDVNGPEDDKVEKLMDVLQGLFVQIEAVTKVIQQMYPRRSKKPHGAH
ncbi:zinc finger associated protein [Popillia japonica]|uniref:Zinc finger associated protein n=1 Tax=Popillia japonica TaxID=7064 RepID=A0AAW1KGX6_POPJA